MQLNGFQNAEVKSKRVFVRCGFDVPFDEEGEISDDKRIIECLETLKYLIEHQAKVIIASHNGRPEGQVVVKLSMDKIAKQLEELLKQPVVKLNDCIGPEVEKAVLAMKPGRIVLLENLRFHKEEEKNNDIFAKKLASLGEIYVNEAFANIHRKHASMIGITRYLPAYAGFRLQKEIEVLSKVVQDPERPLVAVIGGAKISDKIRVIKKFLSIADHVLLGGALANTILKAQGLSIGKSLVEEKMTPIATSLPLTSTKLHVPVDVVTGKEADKNTETSTRAVANVADDEYIYDIGPDTIKLYEMILKKAGTIVWGGPMGYFELKPFARGTFSIAKIIAKTQAMTVVGGGDTITALDEAGCEGKISFVSTGGGAMLEFLEGKHLPALEILINNNAK